MPERLTTPFLARRAYRMRRLMDAARLLPVLGAAGMILPVLSAARDPRDTLWFGGGLGWFLGLWLALVMGAWLLGRALAPAVSATEDAPEDDTPATSTGPRDAV